MFVKVMRNAAQGEVPSDWRLDEVPHFRHVVVSALKDDSGAEVGRQIELRYDPPQDAIIIQLPRDGDVVYFENDAGDTTVDSVRWPPRENTRRGKRVFRATDNEERAQP